MQYLINLRAMKKVIFFLLSVILVSCSNDDDPVIPPTPGDPTDPVEIGKAIIFNFVPTQYQRTIKLSVKAGDLTIDWGDGFSDTNKTGDKKNFQDYSHTYLGEEDTFKITISTDELLGLSVPAEGYPRENVLIGECPLLDTLSLRSFSASKLDFSACPELVSLTLYHVTSLSEVKFNNNDKLKMLQIHDAPITSLDVTGVPNLKHLSCSSTNVHKINLSPNIEELDCAFNKLEEVDLLELKKLRYLNLSSNSLKSINVSNNAELQFLDIGFGSEIKELNVTNNKKLVTLKCQYNPLTELDLSQNLLLEELNCSSSPLQSLNIKENKALEDLTFISCGFKTLDLTENTNLKSIVFTHSNLEELYMNAPSLNYLGVADCMFTDEGLNNLFKQLPVRTSEEPGILYVLANPGYDTADFSIAKQKGWKEN